jgi:hypothetical protein
MFGYMMNFLKSLAGTSDTTDGNEDEDQLMFPGLVNLSGITEATGDGNDTTVGDGGNDGGGNDGNDGGDDGGNDPNDPNVAGGNDGTAGNGGGGGLPLPPPPPPPTAHQPLQLATRAAFVARQDLLGMRMQQLAPTIDAKNVAMLNPVYCHAIWDLLITRAILISTIYPSILLNIWLLTFKIHLLTSEPYLTS